MSIGHISYTTYHQASVLLISINSNPNVIKIKQWYVNLSRMTFHKEQIKKMMLKSKFCSMLKVMKIMKITEYSSHGEFCLHNKHEQKVHYFLI